MGAALTCLQGVCCSTSILSRMLGGVVGLSKHLGGTTKDANGGGDDDDGISVKKANLIELGFFILNSFLAWSMTRDVLQRDVNRWLQWKFTCDHGQCFGIPAAGKILLALMFYQVLMLIGYVFLYFTNKKENLEKFHQLHNNYWTVKFLVWGFMLIILFLTVHWEFFAKTMGVWVTMAGIFVIYQVIMSVEFAFAKGLWFTRRLPEEGETNGTMVLGLILMFLLIGGFFALHIGFFIYYSRLDIYCSREIGFLLFNFIVSLLGITTSISTWAQDKRQSMGLISSSICVAYASYLLIAGYTSAPGSACNPFPLSRTNSLMITLISGALVFLSTGYVAMKTLKSETEILGDDKDSDSCELDDPEIGQRHILYRLVLIGGTAYIFMMITDWGSITEQQGVFNSLGYGIVSSWVKIVSSWLTHVVFFLGVVLPYLCQGHEFL